MHAGFERLAKSRPRALRAGFIAFALAQLTVATLAAPVLATRSDVAHWHPPDTEPHVHPLGDVFAAGPIAVPVRRVDVDLGAPTLPALPAARTAPPSPPSTVHGARAPPMRSV